MGRTSPLEQIRRARTLNQGQVATILAISQQTYSKYESGRLTMPRHLRLRVAALLGVRERDLFPHLYPADGVSAGVSASPAVQAEG